MFIEIFKGLCWGLGFSISTASVYVCTAMYSLSSIQHEQIKDLRYLLEQEVSSYYDLMKPDVLSFEVKEESVVTTTRTIKIDAAQILKNFAHIKFYLFSDQSDGESKLLGICRQEIEIDTSDDEYSYFMTTCAPLLDTALDVDRVEIAIGSQSQM